MCFRFHDCICMCHFVRCAYMGVTLASEHAKCIHNYILDTRGDYNSLTSDIFRSTSDHFNIDSLSTCIGFPTKLINNMTW